ncbi:sigma-54-dependent transcriptional regulator [Micavibrio aeruginosavorus]|uniref:Regulatory protein LuxO n=1 Tax=Micavibrio aeruginosavorus EPB TaxID=349215 RepID=M4W167_9BACT|nr:sigma-54 dependent transcriptional regulator [Micavibrio aeruginosavorus]AGH99179.1 Regulatory protein LuxO [Micavibrio aeruginosavorus EPB]
MEPHKTRILLVDDTASLARTYETFLKAQGYDVRCAYTGRDAIEDLKRYGADLMLLDLDLPDCSGLDVMQQTKDMPEHPPVIIITGTDFAPVRDEAMRRGARSILTKPISMDRLSHAVADELDNDLSKKDALAPKDESQMTPHNPTQDRGMNETETMPGNIAGLQPDATPPEPHHAPEQPRRADGYDTQRILQGTDFGGFIGTSPVMMRLYDNIQNAARSSATVFITGESGTGKEVCAEAIHRHSPRSKGPFVPLNCAAIPRDLLESELFGHVRGAFTGAINDREGAAKLADGGTLFLDEIGDMDPNMQTKLLRFLQDGTFQRVGGSRLESVDVRIICATNRDPLDDVRSGRFRADLFYRLHVLPISMPPLRARGDDVIDIAQTLLLRYAAEEKKAFHGFDAAAADILRHYEWPGNIRQLQNIIRNVVVMHDGPMVKAPMLSDRILHSAEAHDMALSGRGPGLSSHGLSPHGLTPPMTLGDLNSGRHDPAHTDAMGGTPIIQPLAITERVAIEQAINVCGGNIPRAAALLDISPSTIYRKKAVWDQADKQGHK